MATKWDFDLSHSNIGFSVRHLMISKVNGRFTQWGGTLEIDDQDISRSRLEVTIQAASIDTQDEKRDAHLKSADFFEVEKYPTIEFTTTGLEGSGEDYVLHGNLTIKGNTKPVDLKLELGGFGPDAYGGTRAGFTATTEISRKDFGVDIQMPMAEFFCPMSCPPAMRSP